MHCDVGLMLDQRQLTLAHCVVYVVLGIIVKVSIYFQYQFHTFSEDTDWQNLRLSISGLQ